MDIVENKKDTEEQKKRRSKGCKIIFLMVGLLVLMLIAVVEDSTLIYETLMGEMWVFSSLVGCLVMFKVFAAAPGPGKPGWEKYKPHRLPTWKIVIFTPVAVFLGFCIPLALGVPVLLHYLTAEEGGEMVVTVKQKISRRYCRRGAEIEEFTYTLNNEICGFNKKTWEGLEPGQKILLKGPVSDFGFTYK